MKGLLALHGIAKFNVRSKAAPQLLSKPCTAEGEPLPPNTVAERGCGLDPACPTRNWLPCGRHAVPPARGSATHPKATTQ
jgi:hypothetical protein